MALATMKRKWTKYQYNCFLWKKSIKATNYNPFIVTFISYGGCGMDGRVGVREGVRRPEGGV